MITGINFNAGPILPGETRPLEVWSNAGPVFVSIECFREPPIPAQLAPCRECGSYTVAPGDTVEVTASQAVFGQRRGFLRVTVRDRDNDKREFILDVSEVSGAGGAAYVTAEL